MKLFRSKSEDNKEPYDEFIATVKLCSGEEILTKVIVDYSSEEEQIIIDKENVTDDIQPKMVLKEKKESKDSKPA